MKKPFIYKNYYDVVILPPPEVRNYAVKLSREICRQFHTNFVLGQSAYLPHISLYHVPLRPEVLPRLNKTLQVILSRFKLGRLHTIGIKKGNAVWIEITNPSWLTKLHLAILKEVAPLRDKTFKVERTWDWAYASLQKKYIENYGSPLVKKYFDSHITINFIDAHKNGNSIIKFIKSVKFKTQGFKVNSISVCRQGPHHTCHEKLFTVYKK